MNSESTISFGDNVRVRAAPLTQELGLAGMAGQVYGETTPSVTNVEVIGEIQEDYAINVFFDDRNEGFWFAPVVALPGGRAASILKLFVCSAFGAFTHSYTQEINHEHPQETVNAFYFPASLNPPRCSMPGGGPGPGYCHHK
jgi:hypothetical protein